MREFSQTGGILPPALFTKIQVLSRLCDQYRVSNGFMEMVLFVAFSTQRQHANFCMRRGVVLNYDSHGNQPARGVFLRQAICPRGSQVNFKTIKVFWVERVITEYTQISWIVNQEITKGLNLWAKNDGSYIINNTSLIKLQAWKGHSFLLQSKRIVVIQLCQIDSSIRLCNDKTMGK